MEQIIMKFNLSIILTILLFSISIFAASPGSLDYSFGNNGKIVNNISVSATGGKILILPDGKLLASGTTNTGVAGTQLYFIKFNVDSTIDTSFGSSGVKLLPNGSAFALQSDGKIVVVATIQQTPVDILEVTRLNADGSLDTSFNGTGTASLTLFSSTDGTSNVEIGQDGKIVVFGASQNVDCTVSRFNSNGTIDATFSSDGKTLVDLGATNQSCEGIIQPDNKILVMSTVSNLGAIGVARLNLNGSFDTSFDTDGIATVTFGGFTFPRSIVLTSANRIIVSGVSGFFGDEDKSVIAQFNANGTLNTNFGTAGKVELVIDPVASESFNQLQMLPNGQIMAKLSIGQGGGFAKFSPAGLLIDTFGVKGIFRGTDMNRSYFAIQEDGKILTIGTRNNAMLITRHINNIQPSPSSDFDGDGFPDTAVYRPSTGNWFLLRSSDNSFAAFQFGLNGDVPIDGDFDGDGKSDLAIFRPSNGVWFFQRSSDGTNLGVTFGNSTDRPIPGDYDKDGKTDIAVFRPSTGEWLILRSSTNFSTFFGYPFGQNGDIPISSERK
jgi:uncharacterized delta-60 repeat protein